MWRLENISARNICSFRELEYTVQQGVTTLIFGHNADNESQQSNGSGKSTLIEAIALGIIGAPLRKVRSEEIINDTAAECQVCLRFVNTVTGTTFVVERTIFRKGTSAVRCTWSEGEETYDVVQPSVDAYNKYILETLGITRDELFSSFILSRHRYSDFLSSSDKDKKEIINRFSNGILVDVAIDRVQNDTEPLRQQLRVAELNLAGIDGRIEILSEQIRQSEENREDYEKSKEERITALKQTCATKQNLIKECKEAVARCHSLKETIEVTDRKIQQAQQQDTPLEECIRTFPELLKTVTEEKVTDWSAILRTKRNDMHKATVELNKLTTVLEASSGKVLTCKQELDKANDAYTRFEAEDKIRMNEIESEVKELNEKHRTLSGQMRVLKSRNSDLSASVEYLSSRLAGTVACPECGHRFLVADADFDIEEASARLEEAKRELQAVEEELLDCTLDAEKAQQMLVSLQSESRRMSADKESREANLQELRRALQSAEYETEGIEFNIQRLRDYIHSRQEEIDGIRQSIYDEAYNILDRASESNKRRAEDYKEQIGTAKCAIETLTETIEELERKSEQDAAASLKESLKTYRKESVVAAAKRDDIQKALNALLEQQQRFLQFKSFLANTKIEALSGMMNRILVDLGSDIRVRFSGYTQLKSGGVREKISVSLIRDGVDCGSFGKFSEGEKMRVNLASVIAMQRLVNENCVDDKGLDLLVIDELGDSLDETGLASTFSALNRLGITALVVSHGLTNESYPYKLHIVKENGESRIR